MLCLCWRKTRRARDGKKANARLNAEHPERDDCGDCNRSAARALAIIWRALAAFTRVQQAIKKHIIFLAMVLLHISLTRKIVPERSLALVKWWIGWRVWPFVRCERRTLCKCRGIHNCRVGVLGCAEWHIWMRWRWWIWYIRGAACAWIGFTYRRVYRLVWINDLRLLRRLYFAAGVCSQRFEF